jgi:hypothetical protein
MRSPALAALARFGKATALNYALLAMDGVYNGAKITNLISTLPSGARSSLIRPSAFPKARAW